MQGRLKQKTEAAMKDQDSPITTPAAAADWRTDIENDTDKYGMEEGGESPGLTDNNESSLII